MNVPDEFDAAAAKVAGQPTDADPIDQAAAQVVQGQRTTLRSSLYGALLENPDVAARAQKLGRKTGLPADVVGRNLPEVERNAKLDEFDQLLQNSPVVAQWLADQNNAKVAHDDVDNMSALDTTLSTLGKAAKYLFSAPDAKNTLMGDVGAGVARASRGAAGIFQAAAEVPAPLLDWMEPITAVGGNPLRRLAEGFAIQGKAAEQTALSLSPKQDGIVAGGVSSGVQSLTQNLLTLPMAFLPGGQSAALYSMAGMTGGQSYQDAREKGLSMQQALPFATSQAVIEYATEKIPVSRLIGDLASNASLRQVVTRQLASEIPGEQVATVLQDLNEWAVLNPDKPFSAYLAERPSAAAQTLIATVVGTGGNIAVMSAVERATRTAEIRAQSAQGAEQRAQVVEQLNNLAAASKVRERDVDTFEQFIAQAAENGSVQHVYIDANTLMQSGMAEQLAQVSPSVAAQLQTAVVTGAEIQIPVAEYTARIAGSEFAQSLVDDIRVEGEQFTRREAQEYMQNQAGELQAEVERVLAEKQNDEVFKASAETVKAEIKSQLDTVARFTPQVNEAYASMVGNFYAVMGAKIGATPEEVFAKYPLRVQAEGVGGGEVLEQSFADDPKRWEMLTAEWSSLPAPESTKTIGDITYEYRTADSANPFATPTVTAVKSGQVVGTLAVADRGENNVGVVQVRKEDRRKGVASSMYAFAEEVTGKKFVPESSQSADAQAMWASPNRNFGVKKLNQQLNQSQPLPATIEIDGKQRSTTNSNGQPIAATEEGVRNFWKWFGDSKVVDAEGRPLVVYHSTLDDKVKFNKSGQFMGYTGVSGISVTDNPEMASRYLDRFGPFRYDGKSFEKNVMPLYVRAENPLERDEPFKTNLPLGAPLPEGYVSVVEKMGHDALIRNDAISRKGPVKHSDAKNAIKGREIVVFNPTQIKSAIGNSGEFDPANPNILMQSGNERDLIVAHNLTADNLRNALELGGLPAPSLAITKVDSPIQGFGEITLVGDAKLAKPSAKNPVFNADVYSPRFPDVKVKVDDRKVVATLYPLHEAAKDVGLYAVSPDRVADEMGRNQLVRSIGDVVNDLGMRYGYAVRVLGKDITVPMKTVEPKVDLRPTAGSIVTQEPLVGVLASIPEFGKTVTADSEESAKIAQALYSAMINRFIAGESEKGNGDGVEAGVALANRRIKMFADGEGESIEMAPGVTATWPERMTLPGLSKLWNAWRAQGSTTDAAPQPAQPRQEVDIEALSKTIDEVVDKDQMRQWVRDQLAPTVGEKRIVKEDGKTAAYSLQNIVKAMTGKVRDAEGFNYGLGNARSKGAKSFKSIADIQANRDQVKAKDDADAAIKEAEERFSDLSDELDQYLTLKGSMYSPSSFEALADAIGLSYSQGIDSALSMAGFRGVPAETVKKVQGFASELTSLPTEYFEAKPQRAVGVDEFRGAVIPDTTPADVRNALADMGLTLVEYRKGDEASRAQAARTLAEQLDAETKDVLFQTRGANRGSFNPSTNTITLLKNADLSTFLHEAGHFFLEVQFDIASRLAGMRTDGASLSEGEQQIVDDADALLKWFGVESVPEWYSLDFEEKRGYHEKFARGFEAYLFEGKAPSIELNRIFQTFRGWLTQVYRNIVESARQALKAAGEGTSERAAVGKALDVQLSDEVRAVFDRMLATNEEIRIAEQARSMMPLFENYEDAKGKVAWGIDEFKAYQALGVEATAEAIQDVQARTLRDLAWTRNARGREIKRLQKQAAELRREVQIEARREIMSQPIYRAWQFLTGKLDVDRTSPQEDYNLFLKQFGLTERAVQADMLSVGVEPAPAGSPDMVERKASTVAGDGMFAKVAAKPGDVLARASGEGVKYPAGRWTNHSGKPNAQLVKNDRGGVDLVATRPIAEGDEVFINYRQAARLQGMRPVGSGRSDTVDPTVDSLFTAIAKLGGLSKDEVVAQWGTDPKDKPASGVFGKPVWRREGGRSIDSMAEALGELGYLPLDENGKADIRDLEERFDAELRGDPVYSYRYDYGATREQRAGDGLNLEALGAGRFDSIELKAMDLPTEIVDRIQSLKMTGKAGLHPDLVADMFNFSSGDELVRTLATTESPKTAIEGLTDARMLEQYGELATPEAIERAADRAIHNEIRARLIAIEANGLAKATGQRKILTSAARDFARAMIARLKVRDIRPSQYASAEVRAAKAAEKASRSGDLAKAAVEKRNQLVNNYATRAAYDAQDEVERITSFFRDVVARPDDRVGKTRDMDVVNAARAVLSNFGYAGKAKTALEYLEAVKEYDPATYDVLAASVRTAEEMATPDIRDLTVEQLRALHDEVQSLWHLAKRNRQMEVDGDLLDREDVAADINARMVEFGIPDTAPGESSAITPAEKRLLQIKGVRSILRRVESWVDQMDGSNKIGAFRRGVFNPVKLAADKYRAAKIDALRQFRDSFDSIAGTMKRSTIYAPELGYTFGKDEGGVALNEILHAILHTGNDSNKRKLLLGRGWAEDVNGTLDTRRWDAFIARMVAEGKLKREHFDFAQSIWDLMESTKPLAQKAHRDAYGKYFSEVTAQEFVDPFGVVRRGGYIPAQVDSRIVQDNDLRKLLEEGKEGMAYAFPATNKGFTQARVEYNRPLMLDLRTLPQHIDKVLLFSYMEMPVRDVTKLLTMKNVRAPLNKIDPTAISHMLMPWLNRSARQQVTTPVPGDAGMSRFFNTLRNRTSMATMFANLSNTAQQITGFSLAAVKVKPRHLLAATAQWISKPRQLARTVAEQSTYMSNRMSSEVDAMLGEIEAVLLDPTMYQRGQEWTKRHTYFMQSAFDNVMGPIIWTGAYNEALEQGYSDKDATHIADGVVRQTQGSTLPEDVSRIETGPAWARIFTQFAGYFNMQANLLGTEFSKVAKEMGLRKGATRGLYIFVAGFYIPALVAEAIAQAFRGGPGDDDDDGEYLDDWLMATLVYGPMRNVTAFVPFAGQVVNSAVARFNGNPVDDRVSVAPVVGALEGVAGVPVDLYQASFDEIRAQRTVKDVATLISLTTGLPASVAAKPIGYLVGVASDKIDPTGEFDFARGLVTGVASPESRGR